MAKNNFVKYGLIGSIVVIMLFLFIGQYVFSGSYPNLDSINMSSSEVAAGSSIVATGTVSNYPTNASTVRIVASGTNNQNTVTVSATLDSSGNWSAPILIPSNVTATEQWNITKVFLTDGSDSTLYVFCSSPNDTSCSNISYGISRTLPSFTVVPRYTSTCTSFEYSSWSTCSTSGVQTRTVTASYPSGCTGGTPAALEQTCAITTTPACGTATSFTTVPTDSNALCSSGTHTTPTLSGTTWSWTCNTSTSINCYAQNPYVVTPVCGSANGHTYSAAPTTTELCNPGTASDFTSSNPWVWTCSGSGGTTTSVQCSTTTNTLLTLPNLTISGEQNTSAVNFYHFIVLADKPGILRSVKIRFISDTNSTFDITIASPTSGSQAERWEVEVAIPSDKVARSWTARVISYEYNNTTDTTASHTYTYTSNYPSTTVSVPATAPATCTSFEYSSWSTCSTSGVQTRTVTASYPSGCTGGTPAALEQTCTPITNTNCYTDWSTCDSTGHQTRSLRTPLPSGCSANDIGSLTRTCSVVEIPVCAYSFSSWANCEKGKQSRTVTAKTPSGCRENLTEPLERTCTTSDQTLNPVTNSAVQCVYTYGSWGDCINGKQFRSVIYKSPDGCVSGATSAITEQSCRSTTTINPIEVISNKLNEATSVTSPAPTIQLPLECSNAGITNGNDCQIYLYQNKIVKECLGNNLTTLEQCRQYFLDKYGKPLKCDGLEAGKCDYIINEVILSDLKNTITQQAQDVLVESSGSTAVINTQTSTITIAPKENNPTEPTTEIKLESLPLSSANGDVSVSLIASTLTKEQQPLIPVVIAIDNNKNGVPDDIEARLNIAPKSREEVDTSKLAGVDKAIIEGKPLEQPKLNSIVTVSANLRVAAIENTKSSGTSTSEKNSLKFSGKAKPNQVVTLFIYSAMPIVLTVKADVNGNWIYNLDKSLVNGKHEVYVAINNDKGRIVESSLPKPFFIEEAQAVTMDEFAGIQDASSVPDQSNMYLIFYIMGALISVLVLVVIFLMIKQRNAN